MPACTSHPRWATFCEGCQLFAVDMMKRICLLASNNKISLNQLLVDPQWQEHSQAGGWPQTMMTEHGESSFIATVLPRALPI